MTPKEGPAINNEAVKSILWCLGLYSIVMGGMCWLILRLSE